MADEKPRRARKRKEVKPKAPPTPAPETWVEREGDGRTDYGGLPDRDLKKNLGCG